VTELWLKVAALRMLSDRAKAAYATAREEVEGVLPRGGRWPVEAGDGTKIGAVSRSRPGKSAHVSDRDAFLAWVKKHYPGDVEPEIEITGTEEQVKAALYESHRELVELRETVSHGLRATVIDTSATYGKPAGPDGELDVPGISVTESSESTVSFLPATGAYDLIAAMVRAGDITLPDLLDDPAAVKADPK
jgi:hypothetical protein